MLALSLFRFYDESVLGTEREKDNEAKVNVKKYFSHVFNGVDMMYKSIDQRDFTISVAISQFIIADVSSFLESYVYPRRHMICNSEVAYIGGYKVGLIFQTENNIISFRNLTNQIVQNDFSISFLHLDTFAHNQYYI